MNRRQGFHIIDALLVCVLVAVLCGAGYAFWHSRKAPTAVSPSPAAIVPVTPDITHASDLDTADKAVEQLDINAATTDIESFEKELEAL